MAKSRNTKLLSNFDCPGGGQVWVEGTTLYVGHMRQPTGTSIVDVADPRNPKLITRIDMPAASAFTTCRSRPPRN